MKKPKYIGPTKTMVEDYPDYEDTGVIDEGGDPTSAELVEPVEVEAPVLGICAGNTELALRLMKAVAVTIDRELPSTKDRIQHAHLRQALESLELLAAHYKRHEV